MNCTYCCRHVIDRHVRLRPYLPVSIAQILAWIRQCSTQEKKVLLKEAALAGQDLLDDTAALTIANEPSLSKDWASEEEDQAWAGIYGDPA